MRAARDLEAEEPGFRHSFAVCPGPPQNRQRFFSIRRARSSKVSLPSLPNLLVRSSLRGFEEPASRLVSEVLLLPLLALLELLGRLLLVLLLVELPRLSELGCFLGSTGISRAVSAWRSQ